jgi:hypothetical protein
MKKKSAPDAADANLPPRLEPCPPLQNAATYAVVGVFGFVTIGLLWLALRENASENTAAAIDQSLWLLLSAIPAGLALWFFQRQTYRLLELIATTWVLAGAAAVTVWAADDVRVFFGLEKRAGALHVLLAIRWCLWTETALLLGAGMGLLFCRLLRLEDPRRRLWTLVSATLALPAATGVLFFPAVAFGLVVTDRINQAKYSAQAHWYAVFWILSCAFTLTNVKRVLSALAVHVNIGNETNAETEDDF